MCIRDSADDIAIITRLNAAARETYLNLKISTQEVRLSINVEETKAVSQARSTRPRQNLVMEEDCCIQAVRGFTYLRATISEDRNKEAE